MIQGYFHRVIRPKAERFSDGQFGLGVQALDTATRQLPFGTKPVQQELPMAAQHPSDFLHGGKLRPHRSPTPRVQKLPRPLRRRIRPEQLEVFLQQITPDRAEIVAQQLGQSDVLLGTQVLRALQEQPSCLGQDGLIALGLERPRFLRPDVINGLIQVGHDVEAIQDMNGVAGLFHNDLQVRPPHIATDVLQCLAAFRAEPPEEPQERADGALLPHPQQSFARGVNLVDQRQILMPPLPLDLIDADGADTRQIHVRPSPGHGHLHRPKDVVPTGVEGLGHLLPTQPLGPPRQKPGIGRGQVVLAICPRQPLHADPTARTFHPPRGVDEEHGQAPQWHKFKPTHGQRIIAWPRVCAPRTTGPAVSARADVCLNDQCLSGVNKPHVLVHKRLEFLQPIQKLLHLHPVSSPLSDGLFALPSLQRRGWDALTHLTSYVTIDSNPLHATHKFFGGANFSKKSESVNNR